MKKKAMLVRHIPAELRLLFRGKSLAAGLTMSEALTALMRMYVQRPRLVEPWVKEVLLERDAKDESENPVG